MAYYTNLIAVWPTLTPGTTAAKLTEINAKTVTQAAPAVMGINTLVSAFDPAELATLTTPQLLTLQIMIASQNSVDVSANTRLRAALLAIFGTKPNTLAALTALAQGYDNAVVPWWKANGYPRPFDLGDLAAAGVS